MKVLIVFCAVLAVCSTTIVAPARAGEEAYDFDFRAVSLKSALVAVAKRQSIKLGPMPSVPDTSSLGVQFTNVRPSQVWDALIRPYHLAYVDDPTTSLRFVGTEAEIASEFPSSQVHEVVALSYPGDISQAGHLSRTLPDVVGAGTQILVDRRAGTVVVIGSASAIERTRAIFAAMNKAKPYATGEYATRAFPLKNMRIAEALQVVNTAIGQISAPNTLAASSSTNSFIASGSTDFLDRVGQVLSSLDVPVPLMKLDVTVVALQPNNDSSDVGVAFGGVTVTGTGVQSSYSTVITQGNAIKVNATLTAMVKRGSAEVLSRGALYSRNNVESDINSVTTYPYILTTGGVSTTTSISNFEAGATIKMTPTFLERGIIASVDASYSTFQGFTPNNGPPIIAKNQSKGDLMLEDGTALVISGFYSDTSSDSTTRIPFLGDLPLIGGFFREHNTSRIRSQIAFIVVPHKGSTQDEIAGEAPAIGFPPSYSINTPIMTVPTPVASPPVHALFAPIPKPAIPVPSPTPMVNGDGTGQVSTTGQEI